MKHQKANYKPSKRYLRELKNSNFLLFIWHKIKNTQGYVYVAGGGFNNDEMPDFPKTLKDFDSVIGATMAQDDFEYIRKNWDNLTKSEK